ncbi:C40 family peptidase [Streptomyces sp. NY05-11A]|uniref:C40 family peptidase n=1 Tax=Streptomyces soliscabiei TaxID=588897 RepID=UPI0029AA8236|nr:NlpC/P60 family protein [Streptomyces sp. NY05-11A]MDX2683161.1 NlpC/P60 family protein [Streptomyces sp. NY05-11A]
MSGRLLRLACTVSTAALAAQAVLAPGLAAAVTEPPEPGERTVTASPTPEPDEPPAAETETPETDERTAAELLVELQRLYREVERATAAFNTTDEQLGRRRAETGRLDAELAKARLSLHDSRGAAGRLARQQYQGSTGISPYVRLLLARDPQHALDQGHVIGRLARERAETVGRLESGERKADGLARRARAALDDQLTLAERAKKERDDVRKRLDDVEELLASLTAEQLTALTELEKKSVAQAQAKLMASGALGTPGTSGVLGAGGVEWKPSAEGARAVRYAVGQIGKPYEWGAEGPRSYDCSGLTSEAWGHAGTTIPRTSEEQWARLTRIPLTRLRPGDLVIYFPEATHVAMYLGGGMVIQAPRTGEKVKVTPIAAQPVLGAVRPDPEGKPLDRYEPPRIPQAPATDVR